MISDREPYLTVTMGALRDNGKLPSIWCRTVWRRGMDTKEANMVDRTPILNVRLASLFPQQPFGIPHRIYYSH